MNAVARRTRPRPHFIPVREPGTGWLLFKYDPARHLIEIQRRGKKTIVDLSQLDDNRDL